MTPHARIFAPAAIVMLVACSNDVSDRPGNECPTEKQPTTGSSATQADASGASGNGEHDDHSEVGELQVIATGVGSGPRGFVVHGGTAYAATSDGLFRVSSKGEIEKLDASVVEHVASDGESLVWSTATAITSAPFSDLMARKVTPTKQRAVNLTAQAGRAFFTLISDATDRGPLLWSDIKTGGAPQAVTPNAASYPTDIAADASHVFFFAPPNTKTAEVRRVHAAGGEPERIAFVSSGFGSDLVVTSTTVFFTVNDSLYAMPKTGDVAPRYIASGESPVVDGDGGVYFTSRSTNITSIHHVDANGENRRLVAQHYEEGWLVLAVDDTGVYALSMPTSALYRVTKP